MPLKESTIARFFWPFLAVIVVTGTVVVLKETVSKLVVDRMCMVSLSVNDTFPCLVTVVLVVVDMVCPAIFSHEANTTDKPANTSSAHVLNWGVMCFFII